jgi:uncharacterized protein
MTRRSPGFAAVFVLLFGLFDVAAQQFDSFAVSTEMAPMRDGVRLATDVYRPAAGGQPAAGKFPVLLVRTPYNKAGARSDGEYFARRGYVLLAQDCRGRFASEGDFYAFLNEGEDGYDAIEWAASRPWSNGKVGTLGGSYLAWDQYHASMYRPPHLVTMFAVVGGANFYQEYAYPGGAPNLGWPMWLLNSARTSRHAEQHPDAVAQIGAIAKNPGPWLREDPQKRAGIFQPFPAHRKMYEDFVGNPAFDDYWKQRGWYTAGYYGEMKDVPMLFLTGWYDYFGPGSIQTFAALSRSQKTAKRLIVGPWPHGVGGHECGDASFGDSARVSVRTLMEDWFGHWLKGEPLEAIGPEPVRIFRMGGGGGSRTASDKMHHGGQWRTAAAWPPPAMKPVRYYAQADGGLSVQPPAKAGAPSSYDYDPRNPVPSIGGRYGINPGCAQNQVCSPNLLGCSDTEPLASRSDVLSFSTPPLKAPVEATGNVTAKFWVSSDAADTDFTAKLVDVYPNGYALILTDGQIRARFRKSFEHPEPMKAGAVYEVTIDLGPTSNLFAAGHRIRLDVSSSNFPRIEPHPLKARNSLYHDPDRPSYLELPVVPAAK